VTPVLIFMSLVVVVAVLALAYAAWPHRGAPVPGAPWLGDALERAADAVPVLQDGDLDPVDAPLDEAEPSHR
jgi:hypothetical protein